MKTINSILATMAALLLGFSLNAQTPEEQKYLGKWELSISGMPDGNMEVPLTISFGENGLEGSIVTPDGETMTFESIEVDEDVLLAEFATEGFIVNLELSLEEDGTLSGYMMNAFTVKGKKAKE